MNYNKLENIREGKKITQEKLAEMIGISVSTYKKNISKKNMTVHNLEKACSILNIPISILFEDKDETDASFEESSSSYNITKRDDALIEELRNQLKVKDGQIEFLQNLFEGKE